MQDRFRRVPAAAAEDREGALGTVEQLEQALAIYQLIGAPAARRVQETLLQLAVAGDTADGQPPAGAL